MSQASVRPVGQSDSDLGRVLRRAFECGEEVDLSQRGEKSISSDIVASVLTGEVNAAPGKVPKFRLAGAQITGGIELDGVEITHSIYFRSCHFEQAIMINDARMRAVYLENCDFNELCAEMTRFDGNLIIYDCRVSRLDLLGARVDGILALSRSHIEGVNQVSLQADGISVERDFLVREDFRAAGGMRLPGAVIKGDLDLSSAAVAMPNDRAIGLDLQAARIGGHLKLGPDLRISGGIHLDYSTVDGQIRIDQAKFKSRGDSVFSADRIAIRTDLFIAAESECEGQVLLRGARAAGRIDLEHLHLKGDAGLDCEEVEASVLHLPSGDGVGTLTLNNTHVGVLKGWHMPWPARTFTSGLTYDSLDPIPEVSAQVELLEQNAAGYEPQSYEQLASVYQRVGRDADARAVLMAKQRHRRGNQPFALKVWSYLQDWTVGYGYSPWRAALWLAGLAFIGTVAFSIKHPAPLKPAEAPEFNPALYALDLLLPIISFGQEGAFDPHGWQQWLAAGLVLAGWILATTVVAGVTRVLSRQ